MTYHCVSCGDKLKQIGKTRYYLCHECNRIYKEVFSCGHITVEETI